jgi:hypothetical protein
VEAGRRVLSQTPQRFGPARIELGQASFFQLLAELVGSHTLRALQGKVPMDVRVLELGGEPAAAAFAATREALALKDGGQPEREPLLPDSRRSAEEHRLRKTSGGRGVRQKPA